METKVGSSAWFGQKVLPGLTATGICAVCFGVANLIEKVDGIGEAVRELKPHEERISTLEKNSVDIQMVERVAVALDNAELEGQGNFATKAVSRVLKSEIRIKREGR